jgi:predicted esterase
MKKIILLLVLNFAVVALFSQQVISNGEDTGLGWWAVGSTGSVDTWDTPAKDASNSTNKAFTVWINNDGVAWTGAGLGGLNIDVKLYNTISLMVYKQILGNVQLELKDGINPNVYLHKPYTTPGHWQKLEFTIPETLGNITTIGVSPHFENYSENPIPAGDAHRFWWDEVTAYYNPNAISALYTKEKLTTSFGDDLNYRKLSPPSIENGKKYPLVIIMHGAGERGSNNSNQLLFGADLFANNRNEYPAFVLFPQCPVQYFGPFDTNPTSFDATTFPVNYSISHPIQQVKELIDFYIEKNEIDKDRIYIVGMSMGGMATYDIVCRFPDIFTVAVPICGGVNIERLTGNVKNVYWRIFHGNLDDVVPMQNSQNANNKLTQLGAKTEYIEFPGVKHNAWDNAFAKEDFLPWLFSKTRQQTTGSIVQKENLTPKIYVNKSRLYVEANVTGFFNINVYSTLGENVLTIREGNVNGFTKKQFNLHSLHKGVYLVKLSDSQKSYSTKVRL